MAAPPLRLAIVLQLAAVAAAAVVPVLIGVGLPLAAAGALEPRTLVALAAGVAFLFVALGALALFRAVARPVDRMLAAAERLGPGEGGLPILHPPGEGPTPGLARAAVAFERAALALAEERARLAAKVEELSRADRDLAEARESLLRSERLATVGRLAAGIAHEVGNPLGAIAGYASLARARIGGGASAEAEDFLARIAAEASRIDGIVRGLLDFARPDPPALAAVAVGEAVEGALRLAGVQARFRAVGVERDLPAGLPAVRADPGRLVQVLLNLLLNAGDAMGGRGTVSISARAEGGRVEVAVADRGPGIAPADLPRVFDPFFTTKPPGEGTGLGLAICHRIVESFGGGIVAENREGGGARFRIVLRAEGAGRPAGPA
ncbi:MAG TPA: ATP-binding protein [Anaeromyxobacteraceae bacterium]|nr:ATP-binding protein [Anaeromyxobacteraceae bacterium]